MFKALVLVSTHGVRSSDQTTKNGRLVANGWHKTMDGRCVVVALSATREIQTAFGVRGRGFFTGVEDNSEMTRVVAVSRTSIGGTPFFFFRL